MLLETGDIVIVKGTIFKDNGLYDTRIYGHPAFVVDANDDEFYYLLITSKMGQDGTNDQYYYITSKPHKKCPEHKGFINCKNIYKKEAGFYSIRDDISLKELRDILCRFANYQENVAQDEFYSEVKAKVKHYVN